MRLSCQFGSYRSNIKRINALLKLESSDLSLIIRFAKTTISISRQGTIAKAMNVRRLPERVGKG